MSGISLSTHVLDLDEGMPAVKLTVSLADADGKLLARAGTDADGRVGAWPGVESLTPGTYVLIFEVGPWYAARGTRCFFPEIRILFEADTERHYHVPLLLNRYGYSTYRGS